MLSSIIERLKKKRQKRTSIQKTLPLFLPILIIFFLFILLIAPVSAYDIVVENNVDADSDIDSTANKGTDGATDYTDAQTLDGTDQVIVEADQGGGGDPESWVSPTSFSDPSNDWDNEANAYDENTGSSADCDYGSGSGSTQGYLELYLDSAVDSSKCRWWITTGSKFDTWEVEIRDDPDWTSVLDTGSPTTGAWVNTTYTTQSVDAIRFRFSYSTGSGSGTNSLFETDVLEDATGGASNYQLEWEHQVQSVDGDKYEYYLCVYGYSSSVTESFEIQMWNFGGTTWDTALTIDIDDTEQWYNNSISSSYIDGSDQITYRFRGTVESSDTTQDTLYIDWSGVRAYNFSVYGLPAIFDSLEFSPDSDYHAFDDFPLEFVVESGKTYDVQIRGSDNTGTAVADGFIYYNIGNNPYSSTVLTTSYVVFYNDQSAGNNTHSIYIWVNWGWSSGDSGVTDGTRSFDIEIQIINA